VWMYVYGRLWCGVVTCHVWYKYASFGRVRDSFDDDGVHNLDDQRRKSLCV
jgi:hypothetical protein